MNELTWPIEEESPPIFVLLILDGGVVCVSQSVRSVWSKIYKKLERYLRRIYQKHYFIEFITKCWAPFER